MNIKSIALVAAMLLGISCGAQAEYKFPSTVRPLIKTSWAQNYPFNYLNSIKSNGTTNRQPAGCGAVAMAQVIRYHEFPAISPDKRYHYEWEYMYTTKEKCKTRDQLVAVSKLISDCGISSFTDYGDDTSGTSLSNIMSALKRAYGYSQYISLYQRERFQTPALDSIYRRLIYEELKAGRPIIYRGKKKDSDDAHLFIIDGCSGTKVHVNMGWGGDKDGYYSLDDLGGYSANQVMLVGIADSTYRPTVTDITVKDAGTLGNILSHKQTINIQHLALHGHISAFDLNYLRFMSSLGILSTVDLSDTNLEAITDSAFAGAKGLTHIVLPKTLRHIGKDAFRGCNNLNTIELSPVLEKIDDRAFYGCTSLINIDLPPTLTYIGRSAFNTCRTLFHVTVPDATTYIGDFAFAYCRNLRTLQLPSGIERMGKNITYEDAKLRDSKIEN